MHPLPFLAPRLSLAERVRLWDSLAAPPPRRPVQRGGGRRLPRHLTQPVTGEEVELARKERLEVGHSLRGVVSTPGIGSKCM